MNGRYGLCNAFGPAAARGSLAVGRPPKNRHCLLLVSSEMERTALNLPLAPQTLAKPREGIFANHLTLYICIVLVAALASYGYWLKTRSIFACQAPGYSATRYLAYCGGGRRMRDLLVCPVDLASVPTLCSCLKH